MLVMFSVPSIGQTVSISTTSLPYGSINTSYGPVTLSATGGTAPYSWSLASGAFPTGLSLNGSSGAIGGTPIAGGLFNFTVQAVDSANHSAIRNLSIGILTITTSSVQN